MNMERMSPESQAAIYVALYEIFLAELDLSKLTSEENLTLTEVVVEEIRSNTGNDFSIGDLWNSPY